MSPYRESRVAAPIRPRKRRRAHRKLVGILLAVVALHVGLFSYSLGAWVVVACAGAIVLGVAIAISGRSRTPMTRLCALTWNRGDRLGATLLFFNVIEPRYSKKRIARNRAALAAAQVGMPKYEPRVLPKF